MDSTGGSIYNFIRNLARPDARSYITNSEEMGERRLYLLG
jgi:hypothetical protein